ncbi:MAG TPA: HAD hydrolase-like protein [Alphaproteobacteria bacterium]|nr:HAD hydrolase-like protein [Alphaproteobacteria bacterium]
MALLGVLFDYDGVISDTKSRQFEWFKAWSRQNNVTPKYDDGSKFDYNDLERFLSQYNRVIAQHGIESVYDSFSLPSDFHAKPSKVWTAYEIFKNDNPVKMFNGMFDVLTDIWKMSRLDSDLKRNRVIRLGINTTNSWNSINLDLERFGVRYMFDSRCTTEDLKDFAGEGGNYESINKPSKISVALMMEILGTDGDETIHIGDTIGDLRASYDVKRFSQLKRHNLITIGAGWGFDGPEILNKGYELKDNTGNHLKTIHFTHIAEHPSQLPALIKKYR